MFKSLFNKSDEGIKNEGKQKTEAEIIEIKRCREDVNKLLDSVVDSELGVELKEDSVNGRTPSTSTNNLVECFEYLSVSDTRSEYLNDSGSIDDFDDTPSEVGSIEENRQEFVEDPDKNIINQINSLQCLFTWNIKPIFKKNIISLIQSKYGDYNLNISSSEFTFER